MCLIWVKKGLLSGLKWLPEDVLRLLTSVCIQESDVCVLWTVVLMSLLSSYYCLKSVNDGYESLQLLEQNGGFGNNSAQIPSQINNIHNAGEFCIRLASHFHSSRYVVSFLLKYVTLPL